MDWLVTCTKTQNRFHVILSTTDSFYYFWLRNRISASCFTTCVVGHLCKEEAKTYWEKRYAIAEVYLKGTRLLPHERVLLRAVQLRDIL